MPAASTAPDRSLSAPGERNLPPILTLKEVAQILRCSKAHVANVINGHVEGLPRLTHFAMGRRKLVRREWLDQWMEANKIQC
ncbi:MAG: helix-turn-helix domain-containing protein [Bryobacteraceae bacterium]